MNNKFLKFYLWSVIILSVAGLVYFSFLLLDSTHLVVGNPLLEGLSFPLVIFLFLPYEFFQLPLLILNVLMFFVLYSKKIEKVILILPLILTANSLIILFTDPMSTEFKMPLGIFHILAMLLLAISLIASIKFRKINCQN